jgi:hypothetical protein
MPSITGSPPSAATKAASAKAWITRSVEFGELVGELALKKFEPLVRRADHPDTRRALGDREMLVHSPSIKPNLLEFGAAETKIGKKCGFVREFGWNVDANRLAEQQPQVRHEVSLPITPRCA